MTVVLDLVAVLGPPPAPVPAPAATSPVLIVTGIVSAVVAVVGTFLTIVGLVRAGRSLRETTRPMVVAELRRHPDKRGYRILVIRNYGRSVARDVSVEFMPRLVSPDAADGPATTAVTAIVRRYARPIAVLVPDTDLRNIYFRGTPGPAGVDVNTLPGMPDQVTVTLTYTGPEGHLYRDPFPLDVHLAGLETYVDPEPG